MVYGNAYRTASLEVYPRVCRAAYRPSDRKIDQCVVQMLWILKIDFENVTAGESGVIALTSKFTASSTH